MCAADVEVDEAGGDEESEDGGDEAEGGAGGEVRPVEVFGEREGEEGEGEEGEGGLGGAEEGEGFREGCHFGGTDGGVCGEILSSEVYKNIVDIVETEPPEVLYMQKRLSSRNVSKSQRRWLYINPNPHSQPLPQFHAHQTMKPYRFHAVGA